MKDFFDNEASGYTDDVLDGTAGKKYLSAIECDIVAALKASGVFERDSYLDIGVGNGRFSAMTAPLFKKGVALDLSERMLEKARERLCGEEYASLEFRLGNFETCDLSRDGLFNLVTSFRVFKYFSDIPAAVRKLASVTSENGVCVIQFPNSASYQGVLYKIRSLFRRSKKIAIYLDSLNLVGIDETVRLFESNGFVVERCSRGMILPYFLVARITNDNVLRFIIKIDSGMKKMGLGFMCRDFVITARKRHV